jgi:streptomycin 6-kinase
VPDDPVPVPDPVRRKALAAGPAGGAWLAGLPTVVAEVAAAWGLAVGAPLPGGSEALVLPATTEMGLPAVLKLGIPGGDGWEGEVRTLLSRRGRGYAAVLRHDGGRRALLLERLGPSLADLRWPIDAQIDALCAALDDAWGPPAEALGLPTGDEKAAFLAGFIARAWESAGRPCAERTIDAALRCAERRRLSHRSELAVLAHGDPHPGNALLVPGSVPRRFKFVDPDGLVVERAYDLGIALREWSDELLEGDPLALGGRWCRRLADLGRVAPAPVWEWGLVERVSTGLLCAALGLPDARAMLAVADAWAAGSPW